MKSGYTHITLVTDRSGSMASVAMEAENAVKEFIRTQAAEPGECTLTFIHFDNEVDRVFEGPIGEFAEDGWHLHPRGMTALLDAVGGAIASTGEYLDAMPEHDKPEHVILVVMTDGGENASREYSKSRVQEMVKHQTNKYGWTFVFLGAGLDTFTQGHDLGFAHVTQSAHAGASYASTYAVTGQSVNTVRRGGSANFAGKVDEHGNVIPASK